MKNNLFLNPNVPREEFEKKLDKKIKDFTNLFTKQTPTSFQTTPITKSKVEETIKPSTTNLFQTPTIDYNKKNLFTTPIIDYNKANLYQSVFSQPPAADTTIQSNDTINDVVDKINVLEESPQTQEIKEKSEAELIKDLDWLDNAAAVYQYEEGEPWQAAYKNKTDLGKWFLSRHSKLGNRLTNMLLTGAAADEFPDHVKQAWLESLGQYEQADPTARSISRAVYYGIVDAVNIPLLFTGGIAKLGQPAANAMAKFSFKKALQKKARESGIKKFTKKQKQDLIRKTRIQQARRAGQAGAGYGIGFGGAFDLGYQNLMSEIDPNYEGYNIGQTAIQAGVGGLFGFGLGFAAPKIGYKVGDAFKNKNAKVVSDIVDDAAQKTIAKETAESTSPSTSVYTPKDKKILASNQEAGSPDALRTLKKLEKEGNIDTEPKEGLLFGSGRYNPKTKNIPEEDLAKTNFPNINWKSQELSNNKDYKPNAFIKDSEMRKGNKQIVVSQNVVNTLNKEQAYVAIDDMATSLSKDGTLIISGGKQSVKKPIQNRKILDTAEGFDPNTVEKRVKIDNKIYDVEYKEIMKYDKKLEKEIGTGKYKEFLSEVVGVDNQYIQDELGKRFKSVTKSKDGTTLIAKNKIDKPYPESKGKSFSKEGLMYNPYPNQFNYKTWFTFKSRPIGRTISAISSVLPYGKRVDKLFWQRLTSSQGLLPGDIYKRYIKKNQAQESIVAEGQKIVDEVNINTQKSGWKNRKGETWNKWTQVEKDYAAAILNQISKGRRKFFTMSGPERAKYMTDMYKDLSPDMIKFLQEQGGVDLLGNVPPKLINSLKKFHTFKRKLQEEMEDLGMLEEGSDLHTNFIASMGVDVAKTLEKGIKLSDKRKRVKIDPAKIKKPTDIDLHLNIQYEAFGPEANTWFKNIREVYPERVAKFKQLIRTQLDAAGDADQSILDDILQYNQKDLYKEVNDLRNAIANPNAPISKVFAQQIANKYKQTPAQRLATIRDTEVDNILNSYIDKFTKEELPYSAESGVLGKTNPFASSSESAAIKNTLAPRKLENEVYKSFLGQYEDPNMNFINTVYKLKQNIENYKYELAVKNAYDKGLFDGMTVDTKPFLNAKGRQRRVTGKETEGQVNLSDASLLPQVEGIKQPLRGFIKGERIEYPIKEDIMKSIKQGNMIAPLEIGGVFGMLAKVLTGAQGLSRAAVTYLTVAGYPRNYVGAGFKAGAAGNWSRSSYREAHKFFKSLVGVSNRELDNELLKYTDLGITGTGSRAAELKAILQDVIGDPSIMTNMNSFKIATEKNLGMKIPKNMDDFLKAPKDIVKAGSKIIGKTNKELLKWYQSMDDVWKIYSFLSEKKRYAAILEEDPRILGFRNNKPINPYDVKYTVLNSESQAIPVTYLDDYAAMMVRRHMDNYGEVAQLFKYGRRMPTSDFLAFKVEQVRTTKNIYKTAMEDIREGNKLLKESNGERGTLRKAEGFKRLYSLIGMATSGTALATGIGAGIWSLFTSEETKNKGKYISINGVDYINPYWNANGPGGLRKVGIPDYNKNSEYIQVAPPDKDGNILVLNYSRFNPLAEYSNPLRGILKDLADGKLPADGALDNAAGASLKKIVDMFGPTIVFKAFANAANGVDEYGNKLNDDIDSTFEKITARAKEALAPFVPGFIRQVVKVEDYFSQAAESEEGIALSKGGFKKSPGREVVNALGGAFELLQPGESLKFQIQPIIRNLKDARKSYDDIYSGYANPDETEIVDAYTRALTIEKENLNKLNDLILAARATGLSKKQIYNAITGEGAFPSKYSKLVQNAVNLSPVYFSSIPPLSEKNQKARLALQLKGKKKPGTIAMNADVMQRLTNIRKEFNGTSYDFVTDLKKVQQQEED